MQVRQRHAMAYRARNRYPHTSRTLEASGGRAFFVPGSLRSAIFSPRTTRSYRPSEAVEMDACFVVSFSCAVRGEMDE